MRKLISLCAIACVVSLAASFASAATPGQVPQNALAQMGLAGLQPMSDVQGTTVRGSGASVSGNSYVQAASSNAYTTSFNSYDASGKHTASGSSFSFGAVFGVGATGNYLAGAISGGSAKSSSH